MEFGERCEELVAVGLGADGLISRREALSEGLSPADVRRLIDLARWYGAERIFLEVRPSNPVAKALYDSLGFNEIGRRPSYYPARGGREDAIVMALDMHPRD